MRPRESDEIVVTAVALAEISMALRFGGRSKVQRPVDSLACSHRRVGAIVLRRVDAR